MKSLIFRFYRYPASIQTIMNSYLNFSEMVTDILSGMLSWSMDLDEETAMLLSILPSGFTRQIIMFIEY